MNQVLTKVNCINKKQYTVPYFRSSSVPNVSDKEAPQLIAPNTNHTMANYQVTQNNQPLSTIEIQSGQSPFKVSLAVMNLAYLLVAYSCHLAISYNDVRVKFRFPSRSHKCHILPILI